MCSFGVGDRILYKSDYSKMPAFLLLAFQVRFSENDEHVTQVRGSKDGQENT